MRPEPDYGRVKVKEYLFRQIDRFGVIALLLFCFASNNVIAAPQEGGTQDSIKGDWLGVLSFGGKEFRLLFHLEQSPSGRIEGAFINAARNSKL